MLDQLLGLKKKKRWYDDIRTVEHVS